MSRARWPEALYDYELSAIADEEIAELDLEGGAWVRCRCCDITLRSKGRFGLAAWRRHKDSLRHRNVVVRMSDQSADDESPDYAEFADKMVESMGNNTDYAAKLDRRAMEQVQTKTLARKMALLVTEQQEDIEVLREEVQELKDLVDELRETIDEMRRETREPRMKGMHQKRRLRYDSEYSPLRRRSQSLYGSRDSRQVKVINMFDDEVQLTQSD